jgi:hypothetical protein
MWWMGSVPTLQIQKFIKIGLDTSNIVRIFNMLNKGRAHKIKVMIRFQDPFLFITGISFGIISFFTTSLFPSFMFGMCFGFMILNHMDRIKARRND